MIVIKNVSAEKLELVTHIDLDVEGCRVALAPVPPEQFGPDETICMMGYEPGISYTIRPVKQPEVPRMYGAHGGFAMNN